MADPRRYVKDHPYSETADLMAAVLAEQARHDRAGDGVALFATEHDEAAYRARVAELRDLARRDYTWLDGEV
jgi:hypothetical protein